MNIKSIFEPIDRLINQAKGYIAEQDARRQYIHRVDEKIEIIRPEVENRIAELTALGDQVESDEKLKAQIEGTLSQLENYLENIELIAEKELSLDLLTQEQASDHAGRKEQRKKYTEHQLNRIREQLKNTTNFFEAADFANEIWADFDLFEEFLSDDSVVQLLVDRMNETNTKNTETRMGKDLRKTLEHIRMNLVKSTSWTEQEIVDYKIERDLKLKQLIPVKIPSDRSFHVTILGGAKEMVDELENSYSLPGKLILKWLDITQENEAKGFHHFAKCDLVIFQSLYPSHAKIQSIKTSLDERSIHFVNVVSLGTNKLVGILEDELIRISFQEQFAEK